ncbi:MAG TPA: ELWxxDGT repeat protein [Thermoanaerobaculia bacterium]
MRLLVSFLFALSLSAQTPYLVKDINTTYSRETSSSMPVFQGSWRDRVYFVATLNETSGTELWSTDGTTAGTTMVADILPGSPSSNPGGLSVINDKLLFSARDVNHGIELWTTDGTAAGTNLFLDINPGPSSAQPSSGFVYKNRMYFVADDGTTGRELWTTDGTVAGTRLFKDLEPGAASSAPRYFVILGDTFYFLAGTGLWKTDGTDAGTVRVTTVTARNLAVAGNRIFFEGFTAESNWELWVSDGTEAGTRMVEEIRPGPAGAFTPSTSQPFTVLGNRVIFPATDDEHGREPWVSDGTAEGTHVLRDFKPGPEGAWNNRGLNITVFHGRAVFSAQDEEHGEELWSTDGTEAGTSFYLDVRPGPDSAAPYLPTVAGGKLFFVANGGTRQYESRLFVSDGTASGTRMLRAADGSNVAYYAYLRAIGDKVYFAGQTGLTATEPWVSDGTDAGTHLIANLGADRAPSSSPRLFAGTDRLVFFHATEGTIAESNSAEASLWRSDGTAAGTFKLRETGQHPSELTSVGPYVFFADEENRTRLMMSDGTLAGTHPAGALARHFGTSLSYRFFPFGDTLFVTTDASPRTLWVTTTASPGDPAVNLNVRDVREVVDAGGRYMFFGESPYSFRTALWITDGTLDGTYTVVPELTDNTYGISRLVNAGGTVYFVMQRRDEEKPKLWKSDGTYDGTVPVKELPFGPTVEIEAAGRRVFLTAPDALWTSDGTAEGTIELTKGEFRNPVYEQYLKPVGNRMLVLKPQPGNGPAELWGSDGTVAGTKLLLHRDSDLPIAVIDGAAYFAHSDAQHGSEIWTTDGTAEGTKLRTDVNPGPASSTPNGFTKAGNLLYFSAYAEGIGAELWALPLTDARLTIADARAAESAFAVRFRVSLEGTATQSVTVGYSTSDGTGSAGQDYQAASGTLTFAPGETSKTVDVRILGDASPENNETFFLALQNASGARIVRNEAAGIVDDDDVVADLSVAMQFEGSSFGLYEMAAVTNHGPRSVTNVDVEITAVPGDNGSECLTCRRIPQLAVGATAQVGARDLSTNLQQYRSAIVRSRQEDGNPANNAVSWTISAFGNMAMSPAYLTPGETATVAVAADAPQFPIEPVSTDPSVLAISSPVTKDENGVTRFTVTASKVGLARLAAGRNRLLEVHVVLPGSAPMWTDALEVQVSPYTRIGPPLPLTVIPRGSTPLTGARPTGTVIVMANGQELARGTLTGSSNPLVIPVRFPAPGFFSGEVLYSGDASFLPDVFPIGVHVDKGQVSITGHLEKVPGAAQTYVAKIRVEGARGNAPAGRVHVLHGPDVKGSMTLTPWPDGASTAEVTLQNLPDSPTVTVLYEGSTLYEQETQTIRLVEMRRRPVRH